ncbi:MAG TPA: amino acid permease [Candidatus Obscuribacterales bacterium]
MSLMQTLFRRKNVEAAAQDTGNAEGPQLKKVLTAFDLTMNGIAAIIGAGIFVLIGTVATQYSGPGIWLSFILSGIACVCVAFAYAELAGMIPSAGSAYEYAYATMGEIVAFLMGWTIVLAYAVGTSAVAVGLAGYLASMLAPAGVVIPQAVIQAPPLDSAIGIMAGLLLLGGSVLSNWIVRASGFFWRVVQFIAGIGGVALLATSLSGIQSVNLIAVAAIALLTLHQYHGVKESVRLTTIMSIVETALVIVFVALTLGSVKAENLTPVMPFGFMGILTGAALIFFAYIGFDSITTMGDECKNPKRDLPKAILWSLGVCTVLYILVGVAMVGAVHYTSLDATAPLADVLSKVGWGSLVVLFSAGVLISIKSTLSVLLFAQSRIVMRMGKDGLLPQSLAVVGAKRQTPYVAIFTVGFVSAAAAGLFPIAKLAELINIGILAAFAVVCIGVVILRYTRPDVQRSFRCPLVPWVPILGALISLAMMASLSLITWLIFAGWLVAGAIVYMLYGRRNSKLNGSTPAA